MMTDEELDRDWKPNGRRPQSTIARSFSQELMDIFRIENSVADLDEQVNKKKQEINSQTSELEALEARIREMEQRLKMPAPSAPSSNDRPSNSPRTQRPPVGNAFEDPNAPPALPAKDRSAGSQRREQHKYGSGRPGSARQSQQAVPGALPPTPVGSEGECELVTHPRESSRSPTQARLGASIARVGTSNSSSSSSFNTARFKGITGDDSGSFKSMSASLTFADYVVVSRPDGDGEKDS
ncbi:hypothetical protein B0H67DRAFT_604350 [Lasiosphaeris hirsuta]|uniref:Uncharacterized protein n=1 Tax=Lasiosphaeris hirsuta TaxID=260670 RepID=A0AA39ZXR0_9PEZI|nr:hypothetical protein B0H67DRAFT_604350 [Lasiosphaeris hirsuta]